MFGYPAQLCMHMVRGAERSGPLLLHRQNRSLGRRTTSRTWHEPSATAPCAVLAARTYAQRCRSQHDVAAIHQVLQHRGSHWLALLGKHRIHQLSQLCNLMPPARSCSRSTLDKSCCNCLYALQARHGVQSGNHPMHMPQPRNASTPNTHWNPSSSGCCPLQQLMSTAPAAPWSPVAAKVADGRQPGGPC